MLPSDCCRTCLSSQNLNPIFLSFGQYEKFEAAIFSAFGVKITHNDNLPQQMCATCVNFVNESKKFRKKAEEANIELLKRLQNVQNSNVKVESAQLESQPVTTDVYDDADFKDDDDDVTLDHFQYTNTAGKLEGEEKSKKQVEFECKVQDIVDKPAEIVFDSKKKITSKGKTAKRKPRKKETEKEEKKERVKEEIECEYCHKILTSKLSLRNHYKIHTGFDVVCEHCGKKFITRRLLLMHCRAKHGYEKVDKCSFCDYRASNAEQVKIHERLHTGERPYSCAECGAGFHRKSSYLQHVAVHLPERSVQCELCPARFKSVTLMRIHLHRHRAPSRTFRCGVCGNSFARKRNVARHVTRVHALPATAQNVLATSLK